MKRFQFQLATALDWRKRRMETEQARLDELLALESRLHHALASTAVDRAHSAEDMLHSNSLSASDLAALHAYHQALDRQKRRLEQRLHSTREAIANQRQVLIGAMRDYRLMEKLKDRRFEEWRKQFDREMENEATELYLAKRGRGG
ncbi:MAG: flagellar FliJ family protein [Bryobacterales bacterium]|nr:flagellar FliJ family protein [Bryobacterales bacterium]